MGEEERSRQADADQREVLDAAMEAGHILLIVFRGGLDRIEIHSQQPPSQKFGNDSGNLCSYSYHSIESEDVKQNLRKPKKI